MVTVLKVWRRRSSGCCSGYTMQTEAAKTINQTYLIAALSWSVSVSINHIYNELQGPQTNAGDAEQRKMGSVQQTN